MTDAPDAMSELTALDAAARDTALDPTRSFIVQAPAGSGKTTVLAQRYLKLLAQVERPEEVLAITFTRKATGELRQRVLAALNGSLPCKSAADERTLELARAANQRHRRDGDAPEGLARVPSRLKIMTIDAWQMFLASRLPITARSNVSLRVSDDASELYQRAARLTIAEAEAGDNETLSASIENVLEHLDNSWSRLERLLAHMLAWRAHWLPRLWRPEDLDLRQVVEASLAQIVSRELVAAQQTIDANYLLEAVKICQECADHLLASNRNVPPELAALAANSEPLTTEPGDAERWRAVAWLALTGKGEPRKSEGLNATVGFPPGEPDHKRAGKAWVEKLAENPEYVDALRAVRRLPNVHFDPTVAAALQDLTHVLRFAAQALNAIFTETAECDHVAVAGAARQALVENGEPTDLALRLDLTLRHILVDEFQDTSFEQCALLEALTVGWSKGDGRTLFLVGDPMQSIYQFRGAEVGLFLRTRTHGIGSVHLEPLELRRNFRSASELVEVVNATFAKVFPGVDDPRTGAIRFLASTAGNSTQTPGRYEIHRVERGELEAEAAHIVTAILDLRAAGPHDSIAILGGARNHLLAVCDALRAANLPFNGVKLTPLADTPVVRDLEALTRALLHRGDRTAWLAVLRSPMIGLTLTDLTSLIGDDPAAIVLERMSDATRLAALSADGRARLAQASGVLAACLRERAQRPLAEWVESTWLRLRGPATTAVAADLEVAEAFFAALADRAQRAGGVTSEVLDRLLAALYAPADEIAQGGITVMTVHQSKGLEFDHVFLPGIGRRLKREEAELLNWLELPNSTGSAELLVAPIPRVGDKRGRLGDFIAAQRTERRQNEQSRLLYVAMTRARQSLHLFVHPVWSKEEPARLRADSHSHLATLWPAIDTQCASLPRIKRPSTSESAAPMQRKLRRLPTDWQPPVVSTISIRSAPEQSIADKALEYRWAGETARHIGTVVHRALDWIAKQGRIPSAAEVATWRPVLLAHLQALGVERDQQDSAVKQALVAIDRTLADDKGRWILRPDHRDAHSEYAISGLEGGRVVNAVIDRTFIDTDGTRWIVDFKTSPHEGGAVEEFLAGQIERYRPQLERYARLMREFGDAPVRAGLYFPLLEAWRECPLT